MRPHRVPDERGIALVIALFALVVIGALVAAVFFTAQLEVRSGANTVSGLQAAQAAQGGLDYASANWKRTWALQGIGNSVGVDWVQLGATTGFFTDSITELNDQLVMIRAFGEARNGSGVVQGSRTSGMLFKVSPPDLGIAAAGTVSGTSLYWGGGVIRGADTVPVGGAWSAACASLARAGRPGIRDNGVTANLGVTITGTPSGTSDNDASVAITVAKVEGVFNTLKGMADLSLGSIPGTIQPVLTGAHLCATGSGNSGNWGDPTYAGSGAWAGTHPCANYFPIIYLSSGSNTLSSMAGQGIMLAEGNVILQSGATFYGPIVSRGYVWLQDGSHVYGGIVAENGLYGGGAFQMDYSSCAVTLAEAAAPIGRPLAARSYIRF